MISVDVQRNENNEISTLIVSGHANADEHGRDLICASISVLGQTVILGLYEIAKIDVKYEIRDGYLSLTLPENLTEEERQQANLLLDTMFMGIKYTAESYPGYIRIHDKEV